VKCDDKEWQHCRVEKMGCRGCYYDENIIGKKVKILHKKYDRITGTVVEKRNNEYKIKLDNKIGGCEYYIATDDGFTTIETIEENTQTRHVTISTEKLKELINQNYTTIVMTNEVAGFSESIIKKYNKTDGVNIIITPSKHMQS